jgi:hypothetical protein
VTAEANTTEIFAEIGGHVCKLVKAWPGNTSAD